jgi:hypothetical protein
MLSYASPSTPRLSPHQMEDEVDAVAQMEELELEHLLALSEDNGVPAVPTYMEEVDIPSSPTRYGSDEDEYDDIFMEMVSSQGAAGEQQQFGSIQPQVAYHDTQQEDVDMDMS